MHDQLEGETAVKDASSYWVLDSGVCLLDRCYVCVSLGFFFSDTSRLRTCHGHGVMEISK